MKLPGVDKNSVAGRHTGQVSGRLDLGVDVLAFENSGDRIGAAAVAELRHLLGERRAELLVIVIDGHRRAAQRIRRSAAANSASEAA